MPNFWSHRTKIQDLFLLIRWVTKTIQLQFIILLNEKLLKKETNSVIKLWSSRKSDAWLSTETIFDEFLTLVFCFYKLLQAPTHSYYTELFNSVNQMNQSIFFLLWHWWNSFCSLEQLLLLTVFFLFQVLHRARLLTSVV